MKPLRKILDLSNNIFEYFSMIFLVLMTLIITLQVFTRYFLDMTPRWSEEVALLLMVWFGFIGIAMGVRKGVHLSIEYFVSLFNKKVQFAIGKYVDLITAFFGGTLAYYGYKLCVVTSSSTMPATKLPASSLYIMVPIAGAMMVLYALGNLIGLGIDKSKDEVID